jgi:VWFA-related protein
MEVDAVATDAAGRPVIDLTKEEFELLDDGELQEITFFAAVALPVQAPHPPFLRDVASNAFAEDGRLFVLVLDDIHSHRETTAVIKAAARRLVARLSPEDQVAVLWMSTDERGAFEFTTNHAETLRAIDEFAARKSRGRHTRSRLRRCAQCKSVQ